MKGGSTVEVLLLILYGKIIIVLIRQLNYRRSVCEGEYAWKMEMRTGKSSLSGESDALLSKQWTWMVYSQFKVL